MARVWVDGKEENGLVERREFYCDGDILNGFRQGMVEVEEMQEHFDEMTITVNMKGKHVSEEMT